jgi:hypothetical protein
MVFGSFGAAVFCKCGSAPWGQKIRINTNIKKTQFRQKQQSQKSPTAEEPRPPQKILKILLP